MIKRSIIILITLTFITTACFAGLNPSVDFTAAGIYYMPQQDKDYDDSAYGGEIQSRIWFIDQVGLSLAVGMAEWKAKDYSESYPYYGYTISASVDGDVKLIPIGASLLIRPVKTDRIAMVLEAGVRYVSVDSNIKAKSKATNSAGVDEYSIEETLKIDDGIVGIAALTLEGKITEKITAFIGGGYQFDIDKGDAKAFDAKTGENELEAFFVKIGLGVTL